MVGIRRCDVVWRLIGLTGLGMIGWAGAALAAAADDAVRLSREMVHEAYNFGYQYGGCDLNQAGGKAGERVAKSLAMYGNICEEGVKDKQAGKPANPDQAGISVAEQLAVLAAKEKKPAEARKWFEVAALAGRVKAQLVLGTMYRDGGGGPKDCDKAAYWLKKAAEGGEADAQYTLGLMYHNGQCVTTDYKQAYDYYSKAAEQQHGSAWTNIGIMLINGEGFEQNPVAAYVYWRLGAEFGDAYANELLEKTTFTAEQRQAGEDALQKMMNQGQQ